MTDWRERAVRSETTSREMNEWTEESNVGSRAVGVLETYLCECSDPACTEPIRLLWEEYEDVRAVPVRFAVALNHENPEIDMVVSENERDAIVDKFIGLGRRIARETDPRR